MVQQSDIAYHDQTSWLDRHGQTVLTYISFFIFLVVIGFPFYYIFTSSPSHREMIYSRFHRVIFLLRRPLRITSICGNRFRL